MKKRVVPVLLSILLCACTSIQVSPVDSSIKLGHVCIKKNTKVIIHDFVDVLEDGLARHDVTTELFSGKEAPENCAYILTYTATRKWDMAPFLAYAQLYIKDKEGNTIASARYDHHGGLDFGKWAGTAEKMDPVIDRLFAEVE
ncbi:MAG: Sbal_3080 family lipoprotein [Zoogloeaceae bacterium]|nr:Sbal_3080 family lipoprotein [Zoogloeaceae bacterium]